MFFTTLGTSQSSINSGEGLSRLSTLDVLEEGRFQLGITARALASVLVLAVVVEPGFSFYVRPPRVFRKRHRASLADKAGSCTEGSMLSSRYNTIVRNLYQVNKWHPVKLGLDNSEALYRLLGSPLASKPVFHIAGTNGKGSVAWKISRALRAAGYKDGIFVSPHVSSFRERIQICGKLISEEDVCATVPMIVDLCEEHRLPATFFELTTALAFHHFRSADAVALEVGLGGRLDATNVVTPTVSIITSIGLDHTRILGESVEEIAMEKAGIMKSGIPVRRAVPCAP